MKSEITYGIPLSNNLEQKNTIIQKTLKQKSTFETKKEPSDLFAAGFSLFSYYILAISMSFYNKHFFGVSGMNFDYPLLSTAIQTAFHTLIAGIILMIMRKPDESKKLFFASWNDYKTKIVPCGVAAGLDIGLSHMSLRFITLSLFTIIKSSSPVFSLFASFIIGLEHISKNLISIISVVAIGIIFTALPPDLGGPLPKLEEDLIPDWGNLEGAIIVLSASFLSGIRWALSQLLLTEKDISNVDNIIDVHNGSLYNQMHAPILTIFQTSPIISLTCLISSIFIESWKIIPKSRFFHSTENASITFLFILLGGAVSFLLVLCEFFFISMTSVTTLSIVGITKEIATVLLSVIVLGDHLAWYNYFGLSLTIIGLTMYNKHRYSAGGHIWEVEYVETVAPCGIEVSKPSFIDKKGILHHGFISYENFQQNKPKFQHLQCSTTALTPKI